MKKLVSLVNKDFPEIEAINQRAQQYAASRGIDYEWIRMDKYDEEKAVAALQNADAGIIDCEPYDARVFSRIVPRNRLLIRYGVGYDAVNIPDATECGVKIARTTAANATAVAEMALSMMLALKRRLFSISLASQVWCAELASDLTGCTVGILGFGAVGKALAKLLQGFDCRILVYDSYHDDAAAARLHAEFCDLDTIFREADAISCHLALNKDTAKLVNRKTLAVMKPTAILVNTARGGLVDDEALQEALREGRIAGAGLDVFTTEPLEADSAYRTLKNVVLTPHLASTTQGSFWNMYSACIDIAANFFEGKDDPRLLN